LVIRSVQLQRVTADFGAIGSFRLQNASSRKIQERFVAHALLRAAFTLV
jgi:hypothetical protein